MKYRLWSNTRRIGYGEALYGPHAKQKPGERTKRMAPIVTFHSSSDDTTHTSRTIRPLSTEHFPMKHPRRSK